MWNCELKTRLSDIVSHLRNNYRQILTQQHAKKVFYNVILKCFQNHSLSLFEELKTNKSVFYSEPEVLPCFELNYRFSKRHKTSFTRDNQKTRKSCEHGPENGNPKFNQTKRRSDNGGSAGVDCPIYRRRNKYLQRGHGP